MIKLAIDLDNTLVSHIPVYKKIYRDLKLGRYEAPLTWSFSNWSNEARKAIFDEFLKEHPKELIKLKPYRRVKPVLKYLDDKDYYMEIVTARVDCEENYDFINKLFGKYIDGVKIIGIGVSKIDYLNDNKFDYWIDDMPKDYEKFDGKTILISNVETPYNCHLRPVKKNDKIVCIEYFHDIVNIL